MLTLTGWELLKSDQEFVGVFSFFFFRLLVAFWFWRSTLLDFFFFLFYYLNRKMLKI